MCETLLPDNLGLQRYDNLTLCETVPNKKMFIVLDGYIYFY